MIKYFQVKNRTRGDTEVYYREKVNPRAKPSVEKYIKKNDSIVITGQANSGKTKELMKFKKNASKIWKRKKVIFLDSIVPLSQWIDDNQALDNYAKKDKNKDIKSLKQYQKINLLKEFCQKKRPVIMIDNAHKLTARKIDIVKSCVWRNQKIITTTAVNRLPPSLRETLTYNADVYNFGTKTAFDATNVLIAVFIVLLLLFGMTEVAIITGVLSMAARGRLGSKNNE